MSFYDSDLDLYIFFDSSDNDSDREVKHKDTVGEIEISEKKIKKSKSSVPCLDKIITKREKKQKPTFIECPICVEPIKKSENEFKCFSCKASCCMTCMKTYLLGCEAEPHCIHCRQAISYSNFIEKFDKSWRLNDYKKHKEKILWDKEMSKMPSTVGYLDMQDKKMKYLVESRKYYGIYYNIYDLLHRKLINFDEIPEYKKKMKDALNKYQKFDVLYNQILEELDEKKKKVIRYKWTQVCLTSDCKGFLGEKYDCVLCKKKYCKDCLVEIKEGEENEHTCNEELKETIKMIRKESKPCPKCNEFISKISGCDQMFCTTCGTAFSWKTGQVENGIIHNPHAHQFFENNPQAYDEYMNMRNGVGAGAGQGGNQCRDFLPPYIFCHKMSHLEKSRMGYYHIDYVENIRRHISEYMQYRRDRNEDKMNEDLDNQDMRIKYLEKRLDEKKMKIMIHMRHKKNSFLKLVHENLISTFMVVANLMWNIQEVDNAEQFNRIYTMIEEIRNSTNKTFEFLCLKHNYASTKFKINFDFSVTPTYI